MLRKHTVGVFVRGGALLSLPAVSQDEKPQCKSEASVQAFGSFLKTTNSNGIDQRATDSGGVLASYRYFCNNNHGVEVNYGHSLNTQSYGLATGPLGINAHSNEVTAAYVFRYPLKNITPFVEPGLCGLVFHSTDALGAHNQARTPFQAGCGSAA